MSAPFRARGSLNKGYANGKDSIGTGSVNITFDGSGTTSVTTDVGHQIISAGIARANGESYTPGNSCVVDLRCTFSNSKITATRYFNNWSQSNNVLTYTIVYVYWK